MCVCVCGMILLLYDVDCIIFVCGDVRCERDNALLNLIIYSTKFIYQVVSHTHFTITSHYDAQDT